MKKHVTTRQLGRDQQARKALFRSLISGLIQHEQIVTTFAKGRAVQSIFEKYLTKARSGTLVARRDLQAIVQDRRLVHKLFHEIAPRFEGVPGGYTKLTMVGTRRGDGARTVKLALTKRLAVSTKVDDKPKANTTPKKETKATASPKPIVAPPTEPVKTAHSAPKVVSRVVKRGDR